MDVKIVYWRAQTHQLVLRFSGWWRVEKSDIQCVIRRVKIGIRKRLVGCNCGELGASSQEGYYLIAKGLLQVALNLLLKRGRMLDR